MDRDFDHIEPLAAVGDGDIGRFGVCGETDAIDAGPDFIAEILQSAFGFGIDGDTGIAVVGAGFDGGDPREPLQRGFDRQHHGFFDILGAAATVIDADVDPVEFDLWLHFQRDLFLG